MKKEIYQAAGVEEYWIISAKERAVEIYYLEDGKYDLKYSYILQDDPEALVAIIKMIYQRKEKRLAQGKKCTATDARYFQIAENLLYMELGIALGKPKQEVCQTIIDYITNNGQ